MCLLIEVNVGTVFVDWKETAPVKKQVYNLHVLARVLLRVEGNAQREKLFLLEMKTLEGVGGRLSSAPNLPELGRTNLEKPQRG